MPIDSVEMSINIYSVYLWPQSQIKIRNGMLHQMAFIHSIVLTVNKNPIQLAEKKCKYTAQQKIWEHCDPLKW